MRHIVIAQERRTLVGQRIALHLVAVRLVRQAIAHPQLPRLPGQRQAVGRRKHMLRRTEHRTQLIRGKTDDHILRKGQAATVQHQRPRAQRIRVQQPLGRALEQGQYRALMRIAHFLQRQALAIRCHLPAATRQQIQTASHESQAKRLVFEQIQLADRIDRTVAVGSAQIGRGRRLRHGPGTGQGQCCRPGPPMCECQHACLLCVHGVSSNRPCLPCDGVTPRWRYAAMVAMRPRGVRCRKPCWIR